MQFLIEIKANYFTDTPGIVTHKKNISRGVFKEATNTALEVNVVLLLFNIKTDSVDKIKVITEYFESYKVEFLILLTKIDYYLKKNSIKKFLKLRKV